MIQRIMNLFSRKPKANPHKQTHSPAPPPKTGLSFDHQPDHLPRREATRPSYRVGKHKASDVYKVIDMSG